MKKITRRQFLGLCAGTALLGGGGWAFARGLLLPQVKEKAAVLLGGDKVRALRQIVAGDNKASRTIMWQSPVRLAAPAVELAGGEGGGAVFPAQEEVFSDDGVTNYLYTAALTGLSAGTPYGYRVTADGEAGAWNSLTTEDGGAFTALIFPDSQSNDYSGWKQLAQDAAARTPEAAFFVNMGDLVDNGEDHNQWNQWLTGAEGIIDRIPFAPVMGNHETYTLDWKTRWPEAYLKLFDLPSNGSSVFNRHYYSYDYGDVHFAVVNTQWDELNDFNMGIYDEQLDWLPKDLAASKKKWKIVLLHRDVLKYGIHNRPNRVPGFSEDVGRGFMPILDAAGVDVVLTAHLHTYRNRGHIYNFQASDHGPYYILTGVAGNVRYPGLWIDHELDKNIAPQPETDNYLTLKADENRLHFQCFLPDGTVIDDVTLKK